MKANSPRRNAKLRIVIYFVVTAASFILLTRPDQGNLPSGLYYAATFALFYGRITRDEPERTAGERGFWTIFIASYLGIPGYYFFLHDAPMPPFIAAVLCVMTLVFCALQWRQVQNADDEELRKYFEAEKWPGG